MSQPPTSGSGRPTAPHGSTQGQSYIDHNTISVWSHSQSDAQILISTCDALLASMICPVSQRTVLLATKAKSMERSLHVMNFEITFTLSPARSAAVFAWLLASSLAALAASAWSLVGSEEPDAPVGLAVNLQWQRKQCHSAHWWEGSKSSCRSKASCPEWPAGVTNHAR